MNKAIVSSKGQIVIPKQLRNKVGLRSGTEILITIRKDHVLELKPIRANIKDFFGMGKGKVKNKIVDIDATIEQAVKDNDRN